MTIKALVPIAPGTEEMEAITIIDVLIRANYQVTVASVDPEGALTFNGSRGIPLAAQVKLVDVADEEFDVIAMPGGVGGAEVFQKSILLVEMIKQQHYDGRLNAAICATPALMLQHHGLYPDALMTCHPSFKSHIPEQNWREKRVTYDQIHKLLTSQGPATAFEFAMEIIILLSGKAFAWSVAKPMVPLPNLHYHELGAKGV
ncbi:DJ-1 family glyoxalase III [Vibrio breoganii]|uniref:DJ-1 family protein n=2 Tax=Vibrio breoganii TaxID=553239 RepID=A0AAP8MX76_9VIBR|nr:DJ-1 family glyoxalase III [Vibrio breoganii]NMO75400.1 DJ-1 family protein [Vibrio breoganii]NMR71927.1 DJ-1 family protein [Vibrio breoganii]OED91697.1 oxidative-stress-resistance chaperone [Vibrio breoganii ZF-55]PMG02323.1 oxidative-stress-resistance chaperone [Vibrio breoganii]PMK21130.1 oxidative-stress-resistance chaperone [Vibrio breoganii]